MDRNSVVLVNEWDEDIAVMDKLEAHKLGKLHRAFSIFIFNNQGEILLQQRANDKYHGGGLWTNTCCSHPQLAEDIKESAEKRLEFEMGFHTKLEKKFHFIYHAQVENNLIEHEFDHVFVGIYNENPIPNIQEVTNYKWMKLNDLESWILKEPSAFTYWFKEALPILKSHL